MSQRRDIAVVIQGGVSPSAELQLLKHLYRAVNSLCTDADVDVVSLLANFGPFAGSTRCYRRSVLHECEFDERLVDSLIGGSHADDSEQRKRSIERGKR